MKLPIILTIFFPTTWVLYMLIEISSEFRWEWPRRVLLVYATFLTVMWSAIFAAAVVGY